MSGTGPLPRIDEPPESWVADPNRWARARPVRLLVALLLVAFGAGWVVSGDWIGGLVAATFAALPALAVTATRYLPELARRVDGQDARLSRVERQTAEQHLSVLAVSERQRNHELDCGRDELARRRAKKESS